MDRRHRQVAVGRLGPQPAFGIDQGGQRAHQRRERVRVVAPACVIQQRGVGEKRARAWSRDGADAPGRTASAGGAGGGVPAPEVNGLPRSSRPARAGTWCRSTGSGPGRRPAQVDEDLRATASTAASSGFGQKTTPGPCRSLAVTSTMDDVCSVMECSGKLFGKGRDQTAVSHSAYFGLRPLTMSKNAVWIFSVIGPREPLPSSMRSSSRIGVTSAAVPVKKTSSAMQVLVARDALFLQLQAQILADREHGVAGDAVEGAGRQVGRVDDAVLDHEDVLARAFGHEGRWRRAATALVVAVVRPPCWPRIDWCSSFALACVIVMLTWWRV